MLPLGLGPPPNERTELPVTRQIAGKAYEGIDASYSIMGQAGMHRDADNVHVVADPCRSRNRV